ncbi:MAG: hypothetical protein ABIO82_00105 [Ginsengibacter sp.]
MNKRRYSSLSKWGSFFNLSFSSHELLNKKIFGVDRVKRKVLVIEEKNGSDSPYIIELDKVTSISTETVYDSIRPGELGKKRLEEFLKAVHLKFQFGDGRDAVVLPFFDNQKNDISDLPLLVKKTKNWKIIFSKMAGTHIENNPSPALQ